MSKTREEIRSALKSLDRVLGKCRTTTEDELDECVRTLEELSRACERYAGFKHTIQETVEFADMIRASLDEVAVRIKNRRRNQ